MSEQSQQQTPDHSRQVDISDDDLPLHCPLVRQTLWDSHPRVYLPIASGGQASCPYCGTIYRLKP